MSSVAEQRKHQTSDGDAILNALPNPVLVVGPGLCAAAFRSRPLVVPSADPPVRRTLLAPTAAAPDRTTGVAMNTKLVALVLVVALVVTGIGTGLAVLLG